ncbi:MAG: response regulator transcription factor [Acidobacteriota bacterium]|nr:response regulator transcription factor [Acidobacteriota bacterium]
MARLRLLICDDHTLVRQGIRKILEEQPDWEVVAEADDGRSAVDQALALLPDVAILDVGTPQLNGIDAARLIVKKAPSIKVLMLSMHSDEAYVARSLGAGAKGYLLKDSAGTDLIRAVAAVAEGHSFFSPAVSRLMMDDYVRRAAGSDCGDRYDALSDREREIFQLVAEGRSNKAVAAQLSISAATVETHRARILQKLDVHNTAELVLYAVRRGIVA